MGGVSSAIEAAARGFGAEVRVSARVARVLVEGGRAAGVVLDNGDELRASVIVSTLHPKTAFLDQVGARPPARRLRHRHRALEDPQRRREDQPGPERAARLHRRPRLAAAGAPHRLGRDGAQHGVHRAGVPGGPGGPASDAAVQRRRHPHHVRQDPVPGGHPHHVAVHPVGAGRLERGAAHRGAGGLRRPHGRLLQRAGPQLQGARSCTATSSAPTRWSTSTAWSAATSSTASCPWSSCSTCGRPPATPTTARPGRPVLRQLGHARGRRRVRHPGLAGGQGSDRGPQDGAPRRPG